MGKEIERKFLVNSHEFRSKAKGSVIKQGFLNTDPQRVVRIRVRDDHAYLTIKGKSKGMERTEFEYEIPVDDANSMIEELCLKPVIEKIRYVVVFGNHTWEIDEFRGENEGLVIAEVELKNENEDLILPDWIGKEVTGNHKYYNNNLINNPYKTWNQS